MVVCSVKMRVRECQCEDTGSENASVISPDVTGVNFRVISPDVLECHPDIYLLSAVHYRAQMLIILVFNLPH